MNKYYPSVRPEVWKRIVSVIADYENLKKDNTLLARIRVEAYERVCARTDPRTLFVVHQHFKNRIPYIYINEAVSDRQLKRIAHAFIVELGRELGEI